MRRFFLLSLFSLLALVCFSTLAESGPIRRWLSNAPIVRRLAIRRSCPQVTSPIVIGPSCDAAPETCPVPVPALRLVETQQLSQPPSTALEPRPGTGLPLKPGILTPPAESLQLPKSVPISLDPAIVEHLRSVAGKLDSLLLLLSAGLTIFGGGVVLPWVAPVVRGLHVALQAMSQASVIPQPGPQQPVGPVSQAVPSSTVKPAS